jgi:hypothetical protein
MSRRTNRVFTQSGERVVRQSLAHARSHIPDQPEQEPDNRTPCESGVTVDSPPTGSCAPRRRRSKTLSPREAFFVSINASVCSFTKSGFGADSNARSHSFRLR